MAGRGHKKSSRPEGRLLQVLRDEEAYFFFAAFFLAGAFLAGAFLAGAFFTAFLAGAAFFTAFLTAFFTVFLALAIAFSFLGTLVLVLIFRPLDLVSRTLGALAPRGLSFNALRRIASVQ